MHDNRQNKNLPARCFFLHVVASEKISKKENVHKYESMSMEKCYYWNQTKSTGKIKNLPAGCFFLDGLASGKISKEAKTKWKNQQGSKNTKQRTISYQENMHNNKQK